MYNFVTTTLINSLTYGKKNENLLTVWDGSKTKAQSTSASGVDTVGTSNASVNTGLNGLTIKRVRDFFANKPGESVLSIYKAPGYDAKLANAVIDLSKIWHYNASASDNTADSNGKVVSAGAGHYRLSIYIRLNGSQNPYYANDYVFKGKPFYTEFIVKTGQSLDDIANNIKKNADKYIAMVYEDKLLDLETYTTKSSIGTGKLEINATDEHQYFYSVAIEKFVNDGYRAFEGVFEPVAETGSVKDIDPKTGNVKDARTNSDAVGGTSAIIVTQGIEGFGNYSHLMKDYRLPTAHNTRWIKIQNDETPMLNTIYDQYVIKYCSERGNMGTSVIGEPTKSVTEHVFWVKHELASTFETALAKIGYTTNAGDVNGNGIIDNDETVSE